MYGIFVIYMCLLNFAIYLSAPFFTPYMLKDLQFDYMTLTLVQATSIITKLLVMPVWGRLIDQFGTRKILVFTGFFIPLVPLLWLFSSNVWYLVVSQVFCGFVWAGFELATFNFMFETTMPSQRIGYFAFYNAMNGVAILLGGLAGALIVRYNHVFWSKYLLVILLSGLARYVVNFSLLHRLQEMRTVEAISYPKLFFKMITTIPAIYLPHFRHKGDKVA
jgi:MFS family permease